MGAFIVCHDDDLVRTTGKKGVIEELTLKEIKEGYRLLDGEEVPTFKELLDLNHEQSPMVVELKVHKKNYKPLAKAAMKVLKKEEGQAERLGLALIHRYQASMVCPPRPQKEHDYAEAPLFLRGTRPRGLPVSDSLFRR